MVINGKTPIIVNGKPTRVCGREFNRAIRKGDADVRDVNSRPLVPSKGLSWHQVASAVRAGKSTQAKAA